MTVAEGPTRKPAEKSFRLVVGLVVAAVVAVGAYSVARRNPSTRAPSATPVGAVVEADLTLITSDRADVSCLSAGTVDRYACGFVEEGKPRPGDERDTLRPYMTGDRHVYLIPGLFLQPSIAKRYQSEPPTVPRDQLRRFTAKCKLKTIGRLEGFKLRWAENGAWSEPQSADVTTVLDCSVTG